MTTLVHSSTQPKPVEKLSVTILYHPIIDIKHICAIKKNLDSKTDLVFWHTICVVPLDADSWWVKEKTVILVIASLYHTSQRGFNDLKIFCADQFVEEALRIKRYLADFFFTTFEVIKASDFTFESCISSEIAQYSSFSLNQRDSIGFQLLDPLKKASDTCFKAITSNKKRLVDYLARHLFFSLQLMSEFKVSLYNGMIFYIKLTDIILAELKSAQLPVEEEYSVCLFLISTFQKFVNTPEFRLASVFDKRYPLELSSEGWNLVKDDFNRLADTNSVRTESLLNEMGMFMVVRNMFTGTRKEKQSAESRWNDNFRNSELSTIALPLLTSDLVEFPYLTAINTFIISCRKAGGTSPDLIQKLMHSIKCFNTENCRSLGPEKTKNVKSWIRQLFDMDKSLLFNSWDSSTLPEKENTKAAGSADKASPTKQLTNAEDKETKNAADESKKFTNKDNLSFNGFNDSNQIDSAFNLLFTDSGILNADKSSKDGFTGFSREDALLVYLISNKPNLPATHIFSEVMAHDGTTKPSYSLSFQHCKENKASANNLFDSKGSTKNKQASFLPTFGKEPFSRMLFQTKKSERKSESFDSLSNTFGLVSLDDSDAGETFTPSRKTSVASVSTEEEHNNEVVESTASVGLDKDVKHSTSGISNTGPETDKKTGVPILETDSSEIDNLKELLEFRPFSPQKDVPASTPVRDGSSLPLPAAKPAEPKGSKGSTGSTGSASLKFISKESSSPAVNMMNLPNTDENVFGKFLDRTKRLLMKDIEKKEYLKAIGYFVGDVVTQEYYEKALSLELLN